MKRGPIIAMIALLALGFWLSMGPSLIWARMHARPHAVVSTLDLGARKIVYERVDSPDERLTHRFLSPAPDLPREPMTSLSFWSHIAQIDQEAGRRHWLLRALNISSWWNVAWIALGLGGQAAFFGRMMVQWLASERQGRSVVPVSFWWLSLVGGVALFAYFVWRRDVVGVLGQSTGIVVYARNIRLIVKARSAPPGDLAVPAGSPSAAAAH